MAMSKAIRRELGKSRELLWHFLESEKCFFCGKPLLYDAKVDFGNATCPPIPVDITIHHKNNNHSDNRPVNRTLAHETCHKSHHAKLVFAKFRAEMDGRHRGSARKRVA